MERDFECKNICAECETRKAIGRPAKLTKDLANRMRRIGGQVAGIKSMMEKEVYCDDVLTQIAAVQSALSSVAKLLLESHMRTCVTERLKKGDGEVVDELVKTVGRLLK
jgi:DNA-binding FrmR family transcriptional regulator